jgi:phospho-N-acetylmuramoyl-pentapeptide-transferase
VVGAYSLIAFWQFQQVCTGEGLAPALQPACYNTRDPFDLAIVSAAFIGALIGFLWWNAPKANVFMGDVGSMSIGGVIAAMAILTRTELLAVLVAGVFVIAPGSVILQRLYFKITRGKRLFLMSPLHHHLEMRGWPEITIVVRMWIIAGMLAVSGIGLFYVEWLSRT